MISGFISPDCVYSSKIIKRRGGGGVQKYIIPAALLQCYDMLRNVKHKNYSSKHRVLDLAVVTEDRVRKGKQSGALWLSRDQCTALT